MEWWSIRFSLPPACWFCSAPVRKLLFESSKTELLKEQGFNHAKRLTQVVSRKVGLPAIPLLERGKATASQSEHKRQERLPELKAAFQFAGKDCEKRIKG
jgi:predicted amidophosphoribosyltransferase